MRRGSYVLALALMGVLALSLLAHLGPARFTVPDRGEQVDVGIFYDRLAPYGEWVEGASDLSQGGSGEGGDSRRHADRPAIPAPGVSRRMKDRR